jgi:hypothetical protein
LPTGTQNAAYSATLAATGGTTPYSWSIASGSLPSGFTLASSTGLISGTSAVVGTSNFTVQVTDANSLTNTKPLSITINTNSIGGGGIALVQANAGQGVGVGSVSVAFPASTTPGNLIIAFVRMATPSQTVSVTDSAGNTYVDAVAHTQTLDGSQVHLFYARNISAATTNTVTATFSASNTQPWLAIYEYKGLSTSNPLDQTAQAEGSSSAPSTGPTPTTTSPNELVFAGFEFSSSYWEAPGSGFTLQQYDTQNSPAATESMVVNSTGSYTASLALSSSPTWSAVVATFRQ